MVMASPLTACLVAIFELQALVGEAGLGGQITGLAWSSRAICSRATASACGA
jgi:hypothetical protein